MKKNKKLSRGMTLVEVIVSMTIFAAMAAAIFSVIAHANSTADRAKMRDVELATQTNIIGRIGKENNAASQLNQVSPNGYTGEYKIQFNVPGQTVDPITGVKVYETDEGAFDAQFDFKLKTVTEAGALTGLTLQSSDLDTDEYLLKFKNDTTESILVQLEIADGYIFEGSDQQYTHTSKTYMKVLPPNTVADIGYCDIDGTGLDAINVQITGLVSNSVSSFGYTTGNFKPDIRTCTVTVAHTGGGDPKIQPTRFYNPS